MNDLINNNKRRQHMSDSHSEPKVDIVKKMKMGDRLFLLPVHIVTCGLQGTDLGRDETAIIQICVNLIDVVKMEIIGEKNIILKASSLLDQNADHEKIHISIHAREMIDFQNISTSLDHINLQKALEDIDSFITDLTLNEEHNEIEIIPVTLGHLPLRSVLHREARFRKISLMNYWYSYFDLYEQMSCTLKSNFNSLTEICSVLQIENSGLSSGIIFNISQAVIYLFKKEHVFSLKHIIKNNYKPSVFHINDPVDEDVVVMIKPIDYKTPISQILPFFNGLNIANGGVAVVMSEGRRSNKILVRFVDKIQRDIALLRDKHHLEPGSTRYVTMSTFDSREFMKIAGYEDDVVKTYLMQLTSQTQFLLRMKGLPFTVTKGDILQFFNSHNTDIQFGLNGIFLVQKPSGDLNGDVFIIFNDDIQATKATSLKGSMIGSRYIEIFHSTPAEMNQVISGIKIGTIQLKISKTSNQKKEIENLDALQPPYQSPFTFLNGNLISNMLSNKIESKGAAILTTLIPNEANDYDFIKFIGEFKGNCLNISRYNLNNLKGYTSYIAEFKDINHAELAIKTLSNKPFKVELTNQEFSVKSILLPLTDGQTQKTFNQHNQMMPKLPFGTVNLVPSMIPFHPTLINPSFNMQNPLQLSNVNVGVIANLYGLGQYNLPNIFTNTLQSNFLSNSLPSQLSIQSPLNHGHTSPTNLNMYGVNNNILLQTPTTVTNFPQPLHIGKSNIVLLHGIRIQLFQQDVDVLFQSLIPYIIELPKLYQSNQSFFVVFSSPDDAKMALQRCPIILYKNQTIQLISIN